MTSLRLAVPAILLLTLAGVKPRPVMQQRASHAWIQEVPFGRGAFQESRSPGRIPLALQPVIGPESRLWMVGGRGVWSSVDGIDWTLVTARLPWGDRYGATTVFFRGELWSIAGEEEHVKLNDVFHSRDGKAWQKAARPPGPPAAGTVRRYFETGCGSLVERAKGVEVTSGQQPTGRSGSK